MFLYFVFVFCMFVCLCVLCCGIVVVCGVFVFFNKPLETHVLHANGKTGGQRYVLNSNAKMYPKFFSFFSKVFLSFIGSTSTRIPFLLKVISHCGMNAWQSLKAVSYFDIPQFFNKKSQHLHCGVFFTNFAVT